MRSTKALAAGVLIAVLLGGCTSDGDDPDPTQTTTSGTDGGGEEPSGPTPEELSAQVLDTAATQEEAPVLATGTGTTNGGNSVTIDVVGVERIEGATLVRMRFSGDTADLGGPSQFGDERYKTVNFARTLYLVDTAVTKTRYLPLQFDDYREACACPYFPLENGSDPQTVTALYPELPPEVTTVDVVANGFLTVPGVPLGG